MKTTEDEPVRKASPAAAPGRAAERTDEEIRPSDPRARRRALAVDDDRIVREIVADALTASGFACTGAASGREALELLRTSGAASAFDVVLVDIRMPEMDGLELLRHIRHPAVSAGGSFVDPAVVMVTVVDDLEQVREALRSGADEYLVKPFTVPQLRLAVEKGLERRRTMRELRKAELAKAELLHLMLHDLRNPLSVTRGYLSLMRSNLARGPSEAGPDASWARDLAAAADACDMTIGMIEQIGELDLSGEPTVAARPEPTDVAALAWGEVERCSGFAARSRKSLRFAGPKEGLVALADRELLRRVLRDLICEGVRYSSGRRDVVVEVGTSADGSEVTVAVSDDGLSVPPGLRGAIFDRMRQGELRSLRARRGQGLALPFAREVCSRMGSRIWVEEPPQPPGGEGQPSDPARRGCKFVVALPARKEPA